MYPDIQQQQFKKKVIFLTIGVALLVLAAVFFTIFGTNSRAGKIAVEVLVLPSTAQITANDQTIKNGTVYLKPGNYTVKMSADGFESKELTTEISQSNPYIQDQLTPVSADAKQYVKDHEKEYLQFESKVGDASREKGESYQEKFPIVKLLPATNVLFQIGYRSPDENTLIVTIHATDPGQRQAALEQIRDWGYDPTDYYIQFSDFSSPFGEDHE
ncbi:hypothetical protein EYC59_00415 [Candidatus Saccharibacteria bacterium]|nr:MAG: hypothetical protein EYC59_00415 [Candidatus Saccharibacteria bacterium]